MRRYKPTILRVIMKKQLLFVILMMYAALGAKAQIRPDTYNITVKSGTEDAGNWTASPNPAEADQEVTIAYNGKKKVKSIKVLKIAKGCPLSVSTVGMVVGTDGLAYDLSDNKILPEDVTAAGVVACRDELHGLGLVISLEDESSNMNWSNANGTKGAAAHKPVVPDYTWKLPRLDEWKMMFKANGGNESSCGGLNTIITAAGGTALEENDAYWTSTVYGDEAAWIAVLNNVNASLYIDPRSNAHRVRACFVFQISTPCKMLSEATAEDIGKVVCAAGYLHEAKTPVPDGCTAAGVLGKVTATGHGLIISLDDAKYQEWFYIEQGESVSKYAGTTLKLLSDDDSRGKLKSYTMLGSIPVSNWGVAQKSDYEAIFKNLGSKKYDDGWTYDDNVNAYITSAGGVRIYSVYWSATKYNDYHFWTFSPNDWYHWSKYEKLYVRPVLGF